MNRDLVQTWSHKLRLLTRNRWLRTYRLQSSARYWKLRNLVERCKFRLATGFFSIRNNAEELRESGSTVMAMVRSVFAKAAFSVLILCVLALFDRYLSSHPRWIYSRFVVRLIQQLPPSHFDANAYTSLFSTLAGVAGVFLGLYFTAVSTLASSVYARVPADVRSLLVADKMSNVYIKLVAYLGVFSLLLLGMQAIGWQVGKATIAVTALLGVLALFSFVKLGMRTFNFYDPPTLAQYSLKELSRFMLNASPRGPHWRDPSFQASYQRSAEHSTETFASIVKLSTNDQYQHLRGDSLKWMAQMTLGVLQHYRIIKPHIPSDSGWFRAELKQQNWLTTNQMNVDLAVTTATTLHPETIRDFQWIERVAAAAIHDLLQCLVSRDHNIEVIEAAQSVVMTIKGFAGNWLVEDAALMQVQLASVAKDYAASIKCSAPAWPEVSNAIFHYAKSALHHCSRACSEQSTGVGGDDPRWVSNL